MQFYLRFSVNELTLPLAYHYQVQSMLYNLMYLDPEYGDQIHDQGHRNGERAFKLFCFGPLAGAYQVNRERKEITFASEVLLEVRTVDLRLAVLWQEALQPGLTAVLCGQPLHLEAVEHDGQVISESCCTIQMISPILAYQSYEREGRVKTKFFNPLDREFEELVNSNFKGKYQALTGEIPEDIHLMALSVGAKDKTVTRYKQTILTGWGGKYLLRGKPKYLSFLYDAGLGAKNAGGFGMFHVIG